MKTVGTKLNNSEYGIFEFCCNEKGLTKSEQLRNLIKYFVNNVNEEIISQNLEIKVEDTKPVAEAKVIRISNDDGKTWIDVD